MSLWFPEYLDDITILMRESEAQIVDRWSYLQVFLSQKKRGIPQGNPSCRHFSRGTWQTKAIYRCWDMVSTQT